MNSYNLAVGMESLVVKYEHNGKQRFMFITVTECKGGYNTELQIMEVRGYQTGTSKTATPTES